MLARTAPRSTRLTLLVATLSVTAAACGSGASAEPQVASLDSVAAAAVDDGTDTSVDPADQQEVLLAFAACMRENGVDMADPTFDADGNAQNGLGIGPDSGIDPRSDEFQAAQEACGGLMEGITLGGGPGGGFDREAIQAASADFTACLRDEGLDVDDLTLGGPGGGDGTAPDGPMPAPGGSVPAGGFEGGPPADGAGPGGEGFDPTTRLIEQLGLDADDPTVIAALEVCQPMLESVFQPANGATDGTDATEATA